MNLTELFEVQRKLDAEIEKKHPTLQGEDRLAKRILALQVELGECANEWRGFKFWSTNQKPNEKVTTKYGMARYIDGVYTVTRPAEYSYPLLEEYVDCLHFILSIGLDTGYETIDFKKEREEYLEVGVNFKDSNVTRQFINMYNHISAFEDQPMNELYIDIVLTFIALGEMLGFTWERIETAYMSKNKINLERQANGY